MEGLKGDRGLLRGKGGVTTCDERWCPTYTVSAVWRDSSLSGLVRPTDTSCPNKTAEVLSSPLILHSNT